MLVGSKAPEFASMDIHGNPINSNQFRGQKTMLSFYRYASCPLCNLRVHELRAKYPEYHAKGLKIIAIFQSPKESIDEYVGPQNAPFPIIGDPDKLLYQLYEVQSSVTAYMKAMVKMKTFYKSAKAGYLFKKPKIENGSTTVPADFLIDEEGVIQHAYYGKDISDHMPLTTVESFLQS